MAKDLELDKELKAKLLKAKSPDEVAGFLKAAGQEADEEAAARIWEEIAHHSADAELSLDELESVTGGADRDWLTDGCAATVEPKSWCWSEDRCTIWDVTYDHQPHCYCRECPTGIMYGIGNSTYQCNVCGALYYDYEYNQPLGAGNGGKRRRRPRKPRP